MGKPIDRVTGDLSSCHSRLQLLHGCFLALLRPEKEENHSAESGRKQAISLWALLSQSRCETVRELLGEPKQNKTKQKRRARTRERAFFMGGGERELFSCATLLHYGDYTKSKRQ